MAGDLNHPFGELPPDDQLDLGDLGGAPVMAGGVQVYAASAEGLPLLIFRFARADGSGFMDPVVLGCDRIHDLVQLSGLVSQATNAAIRASRGQAPRR